MQLFALDEDEKLALADRAIPQRDYLCRECGRSVRVRKGVHRRAHFYHIDPHRTCSQHKKSLEHLQTQLLIQQKIGMEACELECRFDQIGRIADVYWAAEKIVFEVQCSAISAKEVRARCRDYGELGLETVWILHDSYYGQRAVRNAEEWLHGRPCYFTNIDQKGEGEIYDLCSWLNEGFRICWGPKLAIDIAHPVREPQFFDQAPLVLKRRFAVTSLCFAGDLAHATAELWAGARRVEKRLVRLQWKVRIQGIWSHYIVRPYEAVLRTLLEKYCE